MIILFSLSFLAFGNEKLTISKLMDLIESSKSYEEYVYKLTTQFNPKLLGSFFGIIGDNTVSAEKPQIFMQIDAATIAYAPHTYSEVFYGLGEETIQFLIAEKPEGGLSINAFTFEKNGKINPAKEFEMKPSDVKKMHTVELIQKTNRYSEKACLRCHLHPRRRMAEPDNYPRTFLEDEGWRFRSDSQKQIVQQKLELQFQRFLSGGAKESPLYQWLWKQPQVKARNGKLIASDLFNHRETLQTMVASNANEMLAELKRHPNWNQYSDLFVQAVKDSEAFEASLIGMGLTQPEIELNQNRIRKQHAELNLKRMRERNRSTIAWILAEGDEEKVENFKDNDLLLLNRHSIETIGPEALNMIVTDEEWSALSSSEKERKIPQSELGMSRVEFKEIVTSAEVISRTRRRTHAHFVLERILGSTNQPLNYLSFSVRKISAETGGKGVDLLDEYAKALDQPKRAIYHLRPITQCVINRLDEKPSIQTPSPGK